MAARLREKWVEVRSSAGAKELSDVAVGCSASRLAKLYLVAGGELFVSSNWGTPAGLLGQPFGASHLFMLTDTAWGEPYVSSQSRYYSLYL
jgi:hypothetical protein